VVFGWTRKEVDSWCWGGGEKKSVKSGRTGLQMTIGKENIIAERGSAIKTRKLRSGDWPFGWGEAPQGINAPKAKLA